MGRISRLGGQYSPKVAGSSSKAKAKKGSGGKTVDVFHVYLDTSDQFPHKDFLDHFNQYIHYLSLAQLNDVQKRVAHIRDDTLHPHIEEACHLADESINDKMLYSKKEEKNLIELVKRKVKPLKITKYKHTPSGKLTHLFLNKKWMKAETFVHTYLEEEFDLAEQLIADGILLVPHKMHGPMAVIKKIVVILIRSR